MTALKKALLPVLLLILYLTLAGCGSSGTAPASALSCKETADRVQAAAPFAELTDVPASYLEKHLLIEADDLSDWVMRRDAGAASPEMIIILQVKDSADQKTVRQAVADYREEKILEYRDYQPDQVFKLENSKVLENGDRIALIVSPDAAKTTAALGAGWK